MNVSNTRVATINASGIYSNTGTKMIGYDGSIGVATINASALVANTIANASIQTGAIENYLNAQNYSTGMRNRLINGGFDVWQRNTSGSVGYVADRWYMENAGTITRSTDVPSGNVGFAYSANVAVSAATSYGVIKQRIESTNTKDLPGQYVTLSFWAKTTQGDTTLYANLYYGDATDTYNSVTQIATSSVATSSSWRKYSITYGPMPTQVNRGLQVYFFSADAVTSPIYFITGIQLEKGSQATPFEFRQYGTELSLCQRYCYVISNTSDIAALGTGAVYSSSAMNHYINLPTTMRAKPTATTVASGGVWYQTYIGSSGTTSNTAPTLGDWNGNMLRNYMPVGSGWTAGQSSWNHVVQNGALILSAEM
jgi:hypothetical protein